MRVSFPLMVLAALLLTGLSYAEDTVLYSGTWTMKAYAAKGSWQVVKTDEGKLFFVLSDDFKTRNGSKMAAYFCNYPMKALSHSNATRSSLEIGKVHHKGGQRIELPAAAEANLTLYQSVLIYDGSREKIWCMAELHGDDE